MFGSAPPTTKLELEVIVESDPRQRFTLGKAFAARESAQAAELAAAVDDVLRTFGPDARAWPNEALDAIARIEARQRSLVLLRSHARRINVAFEDTLTPSEIKSHG
jgi:hypothetical protein